MDCLLCVAEQREVDTEHILSLLQTSAVYTGNKTVEFDWI